MSRALLNPIADWPRAGGRLRHAVLRETGEELIKGPLPNFIVDRRCTSFLQDFVESGWFGPDFLEGGRTLSADPGKVERARALRGRHLPCSRAGPR